MDGWINSERETQGEGDRERQRERDSELQPPFSPSVRSAMHESQQLTSSIGFLWLKLQLPPCAALLAPPAVATYIHNIYIYVCMYVCTYVRMYVCIVCIYIYAYYNIRRSTEQFQKATCNTLKRTGQASDTQGKCKPPSWIGYVHESMQLGFVCLRRKRIRTIN